MRVRAFFDTDVYVVPVSGGKAQRLTFGNLQTEGLDWAADGKSLIFSSWRLGGAEVVNLWRVPVSGGDPEPLVFGERGRWPTISRNGGRLAYVQRLDSQDIWRVGGPAAPDGEPPQTRFVSSTRRDLHPSYSPDGRQVAFLSLRSGAGEIWICDADGSNQRQLTFLDGPINMFPVWSPDGQRIAFTSLDGGPNYFYVVSVAGGAPKLISAGPGRTPLSSWSRDGRWLYFFSNQRGRREVWKIPAEGGDAIQVTTRGGTWAEESHDGRFLYFSKSAGGRGPPGIWRIPKEGGEEERILDRGGTQHWAVLEGGIVYLDETKTPDALEFYDFASGETRRLAKLQTPVGGPGFTVSPDGRWVLYTSWERAEADIMLVENFE